PQSTSGRGRRDVAQALGPAGQVARSLASTSPRLGLQCREGVFPTPPRGLLHHMASVRNQKYTTRHRLVPRVKVWLESEGRSAFGVGLGGLRQAGGQCGSIREAAGQVGKSYRHIWDRIKDAERANRGPLVETRVGGASARRSSLTDEARRLLVGFLALRER